MLEFALSGFLFLLLIIVTLESAIAGFRALTTQFIASEGVRRGIVAGAPGDPRLTAPQLRTFILGLADSYGIAVAPTDIEICGLENVTAALRCNTENMGNSEQFLYVRVASSTPYFLGVMNIDLLGAALSRNEKF
ncbi:MAG: hypothetical protein KDJ36_18130 [Hyphomicrobiaceae bacterium]|nr:hypothetical protein [Hyphomicrobiaceae bacterium]